MINVIINLSAHDVEINLLTSRVKIGGKGAFDTPSKQKRTSTRCTGIWSYRSVQDLEYSAPDIFKELSAMKGTFTL